MIFYNDYLLYYCLLYTSLYYLLAYVNLFLTYMIIDYLIKKSHIHTYVNMLEEHPISYPKTIGLSIGFLLIFPAMQMIIQREEPGFMAIEQFILTFVVIFFLALFYFVIQSEMCIRDRC